MPEKRSPTSIAFRLNAKLFFRQLRIMLWLDIVICVMFSVGLLYYTEMAALELMTGYAASPSLGVGRNSGAAPAEAKEAAGRVWAEGAEGGIILEENAIRVVYWVKKPPQALYPPDDLGEYFPEKLMNHLPEPMRNAKVGRWLYHGDQNLSFNDWAASLIYQLSVSNAGGWLVAETRLARPAMVFLRCFAALLALEALSLLLSLKSNGRSINKTLKPLQDLTASAQVLSAKGGRLSPEALRRLTGALDSVNVSHLDAGLPLSGVSDDLKPLAAAINEMLARIDEAYHEQIRFVSDASHELRTPIAVIQGYADILSRWGTEDPETMKESIAAIRQEAESMKEMVEQLLFLARGESDFINFEWKAVDVSALGAEVFREIEMIDETHRFTADVAPSVTVEGDDGMLKQLMRILADNSIKYTPAGGHISLRVEKRGAQAAIIIQDEGAGIPEEAIPHIFDRFYRADESRTRDTGGAGLGLSIAKWIAERHKGAIEVMSRENFGTRMTILLPLYQKKAAPP